MFATANTAALPVLASLEDLDLYGISHREFEDARLIAPSYRLWDRNNIVTTFRFKDLLGRWQIARFYGEADPAQVAEVARFGYAYGHAIEYRVTCWGRTQESLGGSEWKAAV